MVEPGRYLVADAGVLRSEVVLVSRERSSRTTSAGCTSTAASSTASPRRWTRRSATGCARRTTAAPPGRSASPGRRATRADVLYEKSDYELPLALARATWSTVLSAGAYTTTYSSVGFNGFPPLETYCLQPSGAPVGAAPEPWRP